MTLRAHRHEHNAKIRRSIVGLGTAFAVLFVPGHGMVFSVYEGPSAAAIGRPNEHAGSLLTESSRRSR